MSDERAVWIDYLRARNCEVSLRGSLLPRRERIRELTNQYSLDYWAAKSEELLRKKKVPASLSIRTLRRMRNGDGKHSVMHLIALAIVLECELDDIADVSAAGREKAPFSKALAVPIDCGQQEITELGCHLREENKAINEAGYRSRRVFSASLVPVQGVALGVGLAFCLGFVTSLNLSAPTHVSSDAAVNSGWTWIDPGNDARIVDHVGPPGRTVCIQAIDAETRLPAKVHLWRDADPGGKKDLDSMTGSRSLETKGFRYSVFVHNTAGKPILAAPCGALLNGKSV